jgi:hypothetical protein
MSKKETIAVTVKNEALAKALGIKVGSKVDVATRGGVPVEKYWRNRFHEAEFDNSLELPKNKPKKEPKGSTSQEPKGSTSQEA